MRARGSTAAACLALALAFGAPGGRADTASADATGRADATAPTGRTTDTALFNAQLFARMPAWGTRQFVVYEHSFFGHGTLPGSRRPSEAGIAAAVASYHEQRGADVARWTARSPLVAIDIERWPLWPFVPLAEHARSVADYADTARRFAEAADVPVCLYGVLPIGGITVTTRAEREPILAEEWREANRVAAQVLGGHVDALCPPLYSYYRGETADERSLYLGQWKTAASASVAIARDLAPELPLRPFVWPRYHAGGGVEGHPPVEPDTWRAQLEHLDGLVEGIIVWGGFDLVERRQMRWDDEAPWWRVLRERLDG